MIGLMIGILLQTNISFEVPHLPTLVAPTPFMTPTQDFVNVPEASIQNNLATAQAQANALPTQIAAQGNQIYMGGRPVLPTNPDTPAMLGYAKWFTSSASYSLVGPLSPIVIHVGIFLTLVIVSLLIRLLTWVIVTLFKIGWWIVRLIYDLIELIPGM